MSQAGLGVASLTSDSTSSKFDGQYVKASELIANNGVSIFESSEDGGRVPALFTLAHETLHAVIELHSPPYIIYDTL